MLHNGLYHYDFKLKDESQKEMMKEINLIYNHQWRKLKFQLILIILL